MRCVIAKMTSANLAVQDEDGNTALMLAAHYENEEAAIALTEGMEPKDLLIRSNNDLSALNSINDNNLNDLFLVFAQKCDLSEINKDELGTVLLNLAEQGRWDLILPQIKNLPATNIFAYMILNIAIDENQWDEAKALIEQIDPVVLASEDAVENSFLAPLETPLTQMLLKGDKNTRSDYHEAVKALINKMTPEALSITFKESTRSNARRNRYARTEIDYITRAINNHVSLEIIQALLDKRDCDKNPEHFKTYLSMAMAMRHATGEYTIAILKKALSESEHILTEHILSGERFQEHILYRITATHVLIDPLRCNDPHILSLICQLMRDDCLIETIENRQTWLHQAVKHYQPNLVR